jgi:hypothetical protein
MVARMRGWKTALRIGLSWLWPAVAMAEPPPPAQRAQVYSAYEQQTIDEVLHALRAQRDPNPEGKTVEDVVVVPLEVFEPRDPVPQWLNVFHVTTRKAVIRRELLLHVGDKYAQVLVDDTLRNIRRLPELSLVLVLTATGTTPDRIRVVVVTKDVWSLRLSWNVVETPGGIEQLALAPTETNLLGSHQTVRAEFILEPSAYTFGLGYTIPRIDDGSHVALVASADVMVNRGTGAPEGTFGSLVTGEPLYSGRTPWAWDSTVAWQDVVVRRYVNAQLDNYVDPATGLAVPFEYRQREYLTTLDLTRSFGWDSKHDVTFSAVINRNVYLTNFPGANPQTVADFVQQKVPVSDTRVGPAIQYHKYTKRYLRAIDFETLALQEDFALGLDVVLRAFPSFRALGSSRDVLALYAAAQYTVPLRDGLARIYVASDTEPEVSRISDAFVNPGARLVSPTVAGIGRIVVDGTLMYRWRNYLNQQVTLGGGDRLRGYPTSFFIGQDWLAYNVEARSRPIEVLTCQLGGVLFYDVANAFPSFGNFQVYQSVGFGFRALFPQLDRIVFRGDLGFPIERPVDPSTGAPIAPYSFLLSFGQAFDVPTVDPTPVLPTGGP